MSKRLQGILKVAISVGLLAILFVMFDFQASMAALRGMRLEYFVIAFGLFQVSLLIRSFRWRFLLDAVDVPVPIHRLLYLYYVGVFFNTFLPSGFGGDAVKMYELTRYSKRGNESVGTVLVDRLAGIIVLFAMGLLAWPFAHGMLPARESWMLMIVSAGGLVASWLVFQRKLVEPIVKILPQSIGSKIQDLYDAVHTCGTGAIWKSLAVSVLFNLALFGLNYYLALALGERVPFIYFVYFMPLISLSMLIPSFGALGTREGAYVLLFGIAGVSEPVAMAMSLAFYLVNVATGVIGALLYGVSALAGMRSKSDEGGAVSATEDVTKQGVR